MQLCVSHRTFYRYLGTSRDSHNELRLMPMSDATQTCTQFRIETFPRAPIFSYALPSGTVHHFDIRRPHDCLEIVADAEVKTHLQNPFDGLDLMADDAGFYADPRTADRYAEFLAPSPYVPDHPGARALANRVFADPSLGYVAHILALNHELFRTLDYDPDVTHVHSTLDEILNLRAGVCQDFAHLMLACLRSQGIPSRYVSGYLYVGDAPSMRGEQATHAWVECVLPDGRWLGLDPTNDLLTNDRYIRVHYGRDYEDVSPTRGVYMGFPAKSLEVSVNVNRINGPSPRSTMVQVSG